MCGRYVLFTAAEQLLREVRQVTGANEVDDVASQIGMQRIYRPSYNIAPTHDVPVVREFRERLAVGPARWGYPSPQGKAVFNARGETAWDKPLFRGSVRCLVPMDGWYEWTGDKGSKQPWFTARTDAHLLFAAGFCRPVEGTVHTTIVTCPAAPELEWLHHRMPSILAPEEVMAWLSCPDDDARDMARRHTPSTVEALESTKAERAVGSVGNNGPELLGNRRRGG